MITLYEKVKIIKNGIVGTVVDAYDKRGKKVYIVENDIANSDGGYELFDCYAEELAQVDDPGLKKERKIS